MLSQKQTKHLELDDACSEGAPSEDSSRAEGGRHMSSARGSVSGSGLPQGRKCCSWFTKRSSTRQLSGGALLCRQAPAVNSPLLRLQRCSARSVRQQYPVDRYHKVWAVGCPRTRSVAPEAQRIYCLRGE